jgi:hypothetical protein
MFNINVMFEKKLINIPNPSDVQMVFFVFTDISPGRNICEYKKSDEIIPTLPLNCEFQLVVRVINLLQELTRKRLPHREKLHRDFLDLKQELEVIPTYLELHLLGNSSS